jgi:acyl dehydratase
MKKKIAFDSMQEGSVFHTLEKPPIDNVRLARYAGASGDFNPIHYDIEYAKKQGLEGNITHGMLVMGMIAEMITSKVDPKYVTNLNAKFVGMTRPGEKITISALIKKKISNEKGKFVIIAAEAKGTAGDIKAKAEATISCF